MCPSTYISYPSCVCSCLSKLSWLNSRSILLSVLSAQTRHIELHAEFPWITDISMRWIFHFLLCYDWKVNPLESKRTIMAGWVLLVHGVEVLLKSYGWVYARGDCNGLQTGVITAIGFLNLCQLVYNSILICTLRISLRGGITLLIHNLLSVAGMKLIISVQLACFKHCFK